jgi:hypothetical protein
MGRPRVAVLVVAGLTLLLALVTLVRPLLQERQRPTATGAPAPVAEVLPVEVPAGESVCAERILLSPRTEVAEVVSVESRRPRPPLTVTADGPGYRSAPVRVPPGPAKHHPVLVGFDAPDRELLGRLCLRNDGTAPATFVGTGEFRTLTRLTTVVAGETQPVDLSVGFYAAEPRSLLADLSGIVHRMTIGRGLLSADWLVWFVLVLAFAGVPAVVFATWRRLVEDDVG